MKVIKLNNIKIVLAAVVLLFCIGCSEQVLQKNIQDANFWVLFENSKAQANENNLTWDFELHRAGKYDVQIIKKGEQTDALPKIELESDGIKINEIPNKIFVINDAKGLKQTVYQFNKTLLFKKPGLKSLKINNPKSIDQIRILPNYRGKLGFGTDTYKTEWEEMHNSSEKQAALSWFKDAKYGMFIHWGLYSQAGGIWEDERMEESKNIGPKVSEWLMFKFKIPRNEYAALAKTFNPDKSFAKNIAKLAKDAGMKYMVITSKHHDGFALFDSKSSEFDMVDATPYKADAIKELYNACLEEGIGFGVYYSHGNDWFNGTDGNFSNVKKVNDSLGVLSHSIGKNQWDPSPNTHAEYLENKAISQVKELLHAMPELRLIWFDGDGYITEDQSFQFYKTVFDINPNVIVNRRVGYDFGDYLDAGDNVIPSADTKLTKHWETCGTTNNSWAYKSYDKDFKSVQEMLYYLVDIASKGGNYLLNIGPDGKGHVPEQSANGLREIGKWLKINGDAIYGTSSWKIIKEGEDETLLRGTEHRAKKGFTSSFSANDFWFTAKENKVYAISLATPENSATIKSLKKGNAQVESVKVLGYKEKVVWKQTEDYLKVDLAGINIGNNGYVLEVTLIDNKN
ncbi:alpha-L-fucosidase [Polaribacter vadi]|uniref:alpha-L-fucosidase n=1 Tax=Polaribacter TaxID=52959 RepID=UPI001C0A2F25|nr:MULTISPECIES: alpha-L-fucosidase [Polaribacter]MBU3011342.1 alpha-L-fucosidase [Polaribacter vadi]MDO6741154.1 alpha-L-fucosidase [Polaribacter sp. 1_MG-2023]